jgi:hypothetical protein
MESDKLISLLEKCGSKNRLEVRLRAISSLVFKLDNGLIDKVPIQAQPFYLRSVIKSILSIVLTVSGYSGEKLRSEEEFVIATLRVVDFFSKLVIAKSVAVEEFGQILSKLYYITTIQNLGLNVKKRIDEVFE